MKGFSYNFNESEYKGYRLIIEKGYFNSFKKLTLDGFKIEYLSPSKIVFTIDVKLLRRLKLFELNVDKPNRHEQTLMLLMSKSKESDIKDIELCLYSDYWFPVKEMDEPKFIKEEQKNRVNIHSKIYNQKFKNVKSF